MSPAYGSTPSHLNHQLPGDKLIYNVLATGTDDAVRAAVAAWCAPGGWRPCRVCWPITPQHLCQANRDNVSDTTASQPDFSKGDGLLPAIAQDAATGDVLMLAY